MTTSLRLCKKTKTEKSDVVPSDIVFEVLKRLPAESGTKTLGRFQLVSKSWANLIRSKTFIRSFPFRRSLTDEPLRLLIALDVKDGQTGKRRCCFFSSSSLPSSSTKISTSFLSRRTYLPKKNPRVDYTYYVNGLMLTGGIIISPCTGKSITLPNIITLRSTQVRRFFGYEPVNAEYKVLRMTQKLKARLEKDAWSGFQVFTLAADKQESWRTIDCSVPHRPLSNGLCIDGAVYYIAHTGTGKSVVRFDLKSEKFDIFAGVSEALLAHRKVPTLINYHGKVATAIHPLRFHRTIDLFVFEAGKQDFKERCFHNLPRPFLNMKGVNHYTGDIIFAPYHPYGPNGASVILYDLKGDNCKMIKMEVDGKPDQNRFSEENYFMGFVESLMLL